MLCRCRADGRTIVSCEHQERVVPHVATLQRRGDVGNTLIYSAQHASERAASFIVNDALVGVCEHTRRPMVSVEVGDCQAGVPEYRAGTSSGE